MTLRELANSNLWTFMRKITLPSVAEAYKEALPALFLFVVVTPLLPIWIVVGAYLARREIRKDVARLDAHRNEAMKKNTCPVCHRTHTTPDPDFPAMERCEDCGSEWVRDTREILLNAREDEETK